jgi:hypothetical protein
MMNGIKWNHNFKFFSVINLKRLFGSLIFNLYFTKSDFLTFLSYNDVVYFWHPKSVT